MPWDKNFNTEEALDCAMGLFWAQGYEATSVADLTRGMGINRGSLYDTFKNKKSLFLEALRRYDEIHRRRRLETLENGDSVVGVIDSLFADWIDQITSDRENRGCFLTNTALELAAHDPEIGVIVAQSQHEMENFFLKLLHRGQATSEIAPDLDPVEVAGQLLASLLGMLVLARSRPEKELLERIRSGAVDQLGIARTKT